MLTLARGFICLASRSLILLLLRIIWVGIVLLSSLVSLGVMCATWVRLARSVSLAVVLTALVAVY